MSIKHLIVGAVVAAALAAWRAFAKSKNISDSPDLDAVVAQELEDVLDTLVDHDYHTKASVAAKQVQDRVPGITREEALARVEAAMARREVK